MRDGGHGGVHEHGGARQPAAYGVGLRQQRYGVRLQRAQREQRRAQRLGDVARLRRQHLLQRRLVAGVAVGADEELHLLPHLQPRRLAHLLELAHQLARPPVGGSI